MPKIGKDWEFDVVWGYFDLNEAKYPRFALELFIVDKERKMIVPISTKGALKKGQKVLKIDRADPSFIETGLDVDEDSFIVESDARAESIVHIRKVKGALKGALAEKYALWSGRSQDKRFIRGHNPPDDSEVLSEFVPWRDDPALYRSLTRHSSDIQLGRAEYDPESRKILVSREKWPNWYWWVLARAQQAYTLNLRPSDRKKWLEACRRHRREATALLSFWMRTRGFDLDITDTSRHAQVAFAEACVLLYAHNDVEFTESSLGRIAQSFADSIFLW